MTKNNDNKNDNSLYAWATGKFTSVAIGLAVGIFIYKSGIIQKTFGKLFKGDPNNQANSHFSNSSHNQQQTHE